MKLTYSGEGSICNTTVKTITQRVDRRSIDVAVFLDFHIVCISPRRVSTYSQTDKAECMELTASQNEIFT